MRDVVFPLMCFVTHFARVITFQACEKSHPSRICIRIHYDDTIKYRYYRYIIANCATRGLRKCLCVRRDVFNVIRKYTDECKCKCNGMSNIRYIQIWAWKCTVKSFVSVALSLIFGSCAHLRLGLKTLRLTHLDLLSLNVAQYIPTIISLLCRVSIKDRYAPT